MPRPMQSQPRNQRYWIFCVAALAVWLALGWPTLQDFIDGTPIGGAPVSALWFVPFVVFGAAVLGAMLSRRTSLTWTLLCV